VLASYLLPTNKISLLNSVINDHFNRKNPLAAVIAGVETIISIDYPRIQKKQPVVNN